MPLYSYSAKPLPKIDKIDPEYFRNSKRIRIEDETKIRATKEDADVYFANDGMDGKQ